MDVIKYNQVKDKPQGGNKMDNMKDVLKRRDNLTEQEAVSEVESAREHLYDIIDCGGGIDEVEDMLACDYGLELDYIMDLLI